MKSFSKHKVLIAVALLFLSTIPTIYAEVFFTGSGGVAADLLPNTPASTTEVQIRAFYACQLQIGDKVLINGGFSIKTGNLFSKSFMQDISSKFSLDTLSISYRFSIEESIGQATLFAGEYESAGSDTFMRRYFGMQGFQSSLLKTQIGQKPASIFAIDGLGFALTTRFKQPVAASLYLYYNEKFDKKHMNIDLRIAGVTDYFIGDFVFGIGLPFEKNPEEADAILVVKRADFHAGLTMLIGNDPYANLYVQLGITRIQMKPNPDERVIALEDLYLFVEPRFVTEKLKMALSFYVLPDAPDDTDDDPDDLLDRVPYIDNSIGMGFSIESHSIRMGSSQGVVGGYVTASIPNPEVTAFDIKDMSVQLAPYTEISIGKGLINVSLQIRLLEYANFGDMFVLSTSYKVEL